MLLHSYCVCLQVRFCYVRPHFPIAQYTLLFQTMYDPSYTLQTRVFFCVCTSDMIFCNAKPIQCGIVHMALHPLHTAYSREQQIYITNGQVDFSMIAKKKLYTKLCCARMDVVVSAEMTVRLKCVYMYVCLEMQTIYTVVQLNDTSCVYSFPCQYKSYLMNLVRIQYKA